MSREAHVRFYESLGVKLPGATHPGVTLLQSEVLGVIYFNCYTPIPLRRNDSCRLNYPIE